MVLVQRALSQSVIHLCSESFICIRQHYLHKRRNIERMICYIVLCAAEVIVNYLASHVLLVYNEARQKEIIRVYDAITRNMPEDQRREYSFNSTIPDDQCELFYYCTVLDDDDDDDDGVRGESKWGGGDHSPVYGQMLWCWG